MRLRRTLILRNEAADRFAVVLRMTGKEMWVDGSVVSFRSKLKERDVVVLNNGKCTLAS